MIVEQLRDVCAMGDVAAIAVAKEHSGHGTPLGQVPAVQAARRRRSEPGVFAGSRWQMPIAVRDTDRDEK